VAFDPSDFVFSRRPTSTLHPMIVTTKTTWTQYPWSSPQSSRDARHPPSGKMDVSHPPSGSLRVAGQLPPGTVGLPGHGAWQNHSVVRDCSSAGVSEFLGVRGLLGAPELWASGDSFFSPTGTVTFKDGRTLLGKASLNGGEATFTTNGLAPGSRCQALFLVFVQPERRETSAHGQSEKTGNNAWDRAPTPTKR
jgi:hypothetical protein